MELVRGVDMNHLIDKRGGLEPMLAVGIVAQALGGLHAAHEVLGEDGTHLGLVHRDLSPHNLMVGFDGVVKLLDFGVAKARMQRTVTLPGIVKGKPLYMSPEQAMGDPLDRRSDLFAIATILYEGLTGRLPFDEADDTKTMEAICAKPPKDAPEIAPELWRVLARAFEKDPKDRFASALELREALVQVVPPASEAELSRVMASSFPERLAELSRYERILAARPALAVKNVAPIDATKVAPAVAAPTAEAERIAEEPTRFVRR